MRAIVSLALGISLTSASAAMAAAHIKVSKPDVAKLISEDKVNLGKDVAPRFAEPIAVNITPASAGEWTSENGADVWTLRLSTDDATSINLGFGGYRMPEGGRLVIGATDGSTRISRAFTAADNNAADALWTPVVMSSDITLKAILPQGKRSQLKLALTSFNYGYREFSVAELMSGSCNVDVVCSEGDNFRDIIRSVAVISTGGSRFCTGFLVNNARQDRKPYFMTAAHCRITASNAASLVAYWNYEHSSCRVANGPDSGRTGDGRLDKFTTGAMFRASQANSDFTLVEFNQAIDPSYGVYYSGWNATAEDAEAVIGIHHPATHEKRISFEYEPTTTSTYLGNDALPGTGTHVRVADWDVGTTEPGSSGSPLFNSRKQVIGQLHGGYAACGNDDPDWYGRFSVSWNGNGTPAGQLKVWLDPDASGILEIDGIDTMEAK